jgi:hypothetical protein
MRMHESTDQSAGFTKVMALINELIHDNRKQLQQIRRMNERVKGQCLISNNKLANRERSFANNLRYFKSHGALALSEKSEAINMQASRKHQAADYAAAQKKYNLAFAEKNKKWATRVADLKLAVTHVDAALKAIATWTPSTKTSFIEEEVQKSVNAYQKTLEYPITFDSDMIQLAASDNKIRQRLFEWVNMLKAAIIDALSFAQSAHKEVTSLHHTMDQQLTNIIKLENADVARLTQSINNWTILIKNYNDNEKIYSALSTQTTNVLKANREWCNVETANYNKNKASMEEQLKVFVGLKEWLRKNYSRVRTWLRKKYNH